MTAEFCLVCRLRRLFLEVELTLLPREWRPDAFCELEVLSTLSEPDYTVTKACKSFLLTPSPLPQGQKSSTMPKVLT